MGKYNAHDPGKYVAWLRILDVPEMLDRLNLFVMLIPFLLHTCSPGQQTQYENRHALIGRLVKTLRRSNHMELGKG